MFEKFKLKNYIRKDLNNQFTIDDNLISAMIYLDKFGKPITKPRNIYVGTVNGNDISVRYKEFSDELQLKEAYNLSRLLSNRDIPHREVIVKTEDVVKKYKNNIDLAQEALKTKLTDIFSFMLDSSKQSINHREYSNCLNQLDDIKFELDN